MLGRIGRAAAGAAVALVLAAGCGDDGNAGIGGAGTATTSASGPGEPTGTTRRDGSGESFGAGFVVVDGTPYDFTVTSCASTSGEAHLTGEGEASVSLGATGLLVQVDELFTTFSVTDFEPLIEGNAVTVSGTGTDLSGGDPVTIELEATCSNF